MLWYMYIDESGDLGFSGRSSKFVIISALLVKDPALLQRIIKNMRRNKFRKELKNAIEIKANSSSRELKTHMLEKLNMIKDLRVFHVVLEKKKLNSRFLMNNKHKQYNFIAGKLAKNIILEGIDVVIRIDKTKGKQLLQEDFNLHFEKLLREKSSVRKVEIYRSYSQAWEGLQFADLLAWSAFQKVEHNNSEYIEIIKNKEVYMLW